MISFAIILDSLPFFASVCPTALCWKKYERKWFLKRWWKNNGFKINYYDNVNNDYANDNNDNNSDNDSNDNVILMMMMRMMVTWKESSW